MTFCIRQEEFIKLRKFNMDIFMLAITGIVFTILLTLCWDWIRKLIKGRTLCEKAWDILVDIPEDKWITSELTNGVDKCCAMGWLAYDKVKQFNGKLLLDQVMYNKNSFSSKFNRIWPHMSNYDITYVNDNITNKYPQSTPKQRVLAWLNDAINLGY